MQYELYIYQLNLTIFLIKFIVNQNTNLIQQNTDINFFIYIDIFIIIWVKKMSKPKNIVQRHDARSNSLCIFDKY